MFQILIYNQVLKEILVLAVFDSGSSIEILDILEKLQPIKFASRLLKINKLVVLKSIIEPYEAQDVGLIYDKFYIR